jgi:hypothetical protein
VRNLAGAFAAADVDGDHRLNLEEFRSLVAEELRDSTSHIEDATVNGWFRALDHHADGSICISEFFVRRRPARRVGCNALRRVRLAARGTAHATPMRGPRHVWHGPRHHGLPTRGPRHVWHGPRHHCGPRDRCALRCQVCVLEQALKRCGSKEGMKSFVERWDRDGKQSLKYARDLT